MTLAIIGGTGIYKIDGLSEIEELEVSTPFGDPSAAIIRAKYQGKAILFLPRHGKNHQLLPHEINYQANIFALKKLGARQIVGISAVGSLREEINPGDFVIPTQYFDFVKGNREKSFFGEGVVAHISTAEPICKNLVSWIANKAQEMDLKIHVNKTYACVDGPRLGTKAESNFLRLAGCDLVGMTNVPEVFLAREAQMCYSSIGIATDYDCWLDDPNQHANVADIIARYGKSLEKIQALLLKLFSSNFPEIEEEYRQSLKYSLLTPDTAIPENKRELLKLLRE